MKEKSNKLEFFTQLGGLRKELWRDGKSCDGAMVVIMLVVVTVKEMVSGPLFWDLLRMSRPVATCWMTAMPVAFH